MKKKLYLSICIPTYNRAEYLRKCIESIVNQNAFIRGDVEIAVSDNCSTDDTEEVVKEYQSKFERIVYYKQEKNTGYINGIMALQLGTGCFRKISNDYFEFVDGSLDLIIEMIKKFNKSKPILYFSNDTIKRDYLYKRKKYFIVESSKDNGCLDDMLKYTSVNTTFYGVYGFWEKDCNDSLLKYYKKNNNFWQCINLMNQYVLEKKVVIVRDKIFNCQVVVKKNVSYGIFHDFYEIFLSIFENYMQKGFASERAVELMKRDLLFDMFLQWGIAAKYDRDKFMFSNTEDIYNCVKDAYSTKWYFPFFLINWNYRCFRKKFKYILQKLGVLAKDTIKKEINR